MKKPKKMKYFNLFIIALIIGAFGFSCKKEKQPKNEDSIENRVLTDAEREFIINHIVSQGHLKEDIVELETCFLVEDDLMFSKNPDSYKQNRQISNNNLVSQTKITSMSVYVNPSLGSEWKSATLLAMNDWNSIQCSKIYFTEAPDAGSADINVTGDWWIFGMGTLPDYAPAGSGFPSAGLPYHTVEINVDYVDEPNAGQKRYIIVHELGHCIGLRHTDNGIGNHIEGTATRDRKSVMDSNRLPNSWKGFTDDDILAVEILYPIDWMYSSGGTSSWFNLSVAGIPLEELRFGKFDNDNKTDVFHSDGGQWRYSSGGTSTWINLSSAGIPIEDLRLGNFDGDNKTDVFHINGSQWRYSSGGTSSWINLSSAGIPIEDLRFGDFDGDNKTDVFHINGSQWRYSSGGTSSWINLSSAGIAIEDLRFGYFDNDNKIDVFHKSGSQWRYSSGGTSSWINLSSSGVPLEDLRFADFNGDGKTDIFTKIGDQWKCSFGGTSSWVNLSSSGVNLEHLRFGDFDGDDNADVFTICGC